MKLCNLALIVLLAALAGAAGGSDLLREERIAKEIEETILSGYPLRLRADGIEFLAIHRESAVAQRRGGVVILHGRNANPDWHGVIHPLRSQLPDSGWETLSIQLPVTSLDAPEESYQALISESFPRIASAINFYQQRGVERIALIGHSLGVRMALEFLAANPDVRVRAVVAVGMSASRSTPVSGNLLALQKVNLPILDIYGSSDFDAVLTTAPLRLAEAHRAGNQAYRQLEVPGADHFFSGLDDLLVQRVRAWLQRIFSH
ncbi:MAG: alpha/beta fold hydrolase [Gammaproteobacteria bacterium]|nr:alpha/beta fold hydrolase [Gammaproteobacteria bacterium]MCB1849432.1 alpha/beta fold hydrolase [Gammaproteobacteria bacterium]MCP5418569.1 alpha/beta fold hydrolase [Chromatiaceae bacterium]